ncbi:MAG: dual specificity protein phosphatase family protein [Actinobacteria bacterium]|nr:dual specificity protein phosphatase family protein [Actinomycetota bacterium]
MMYDARVYSVSERLLAGPYPAPGDVERLRAAGIELFVDLTEAGEYGIAPYDSAGARHVRFPIPDHGVPSEEQMAALLDALDAALGETRGVYVHCLAGAGRTGTVIGCWLVRHGLTGDEALVAIAERRGAGCRPSPETREQRALVLGWAERGRTGH